MGVSHQAALRAVNQAGPAGTISGRLIAEYDQGRAGFGEGELILNMPVRGKIEILSHDTVAVTVTASADGTFRVSVPAGRYTVRGPAAAGKRCASEPGSVHVRSAKTTDVEIFCPRGAYKHPEGH
jgi:hypothetical protein